MELLILGGLAVAGWKLQKDAPVPRASPATAALPPAVADAASDSARFLSQTAAAASPKWQQTGIVGPHTPYDPSKPLPFFKNKGSTLNATQNQRRMEELTGTLGAGSADNTWRHKQEATSRFKPTLQQLDSSGTQGNPQQERRMPYVSQIQNGVPVAPPVHVGRGIGIGTAPAAGGFGGAYRPRVQNVNGYRVQRDNYGRVNMPGAINATISSDPGLLATKAPPRVYEMARRPLIRGSGMAAVAAAKAGEVFTSKVYGCKFPQSGVVGEDFQLTGVADMESSVPAPQQTAGYEYLEERNKSDAHGGSVLNLTGAAAKHAPGAYVENSMNMDMQRVWKTMRETRNGMEAFIISGASGIPAPRAPEQVDLQATQRDQSLEGFAGNPAAYNPTLAVRQQDGLKGTIREQTETDQRGLLGVAFGGAGYGTNAAPVQCTDKQMERLAKRGEDHQLLPDYVFGPENNAAMCLAQTGSEGDVGGLGYVGLPDRTVEERMGIVGSVVPTSTLQPCLASKVDTISNPRANPQDLGVAQAQLAGNYLNRSIV